MNTKQEKNEVRRATLMKEIHELFRQINVRREKATKLFHRYNQLKSQVNP